MEEKKKLILNCEVCDTTRMKEENYSHFEEIVITTELLIVNEMSKGLLNHLPIRLNIEHMMEMTEEPEVKVINAPYEMTKGRPPQKPEILIINGPLKVWPGTGEILEKTVGMVINGSAEFPESLSGLAKQMVVNGPIRTYPDDSVVLEETFTMDRYFPIRAKEGTKYFARNAVIISDKEIDVERLVRKNVTIQTSRFIVPESRLEQCTALVSADVDFVVVPEGLSLVYGNVVLDAELVRRKGRELFVYGDLRLAEQMDMERLPEELDALTVTGSVTLNTDQKEGFLKIHADYRELHVTEPEVSKQERVLEGMTVIRLNKKLFDCSPDGIRIRSAVKVVIEEDVTPEMLLNGLNGINCLHIECNEEQENALYALGVEPGLLQNMSETPEIPSFSSVPDRNQVINAEQYVM